jgi:hypothetical protein
MENFDLNSEALLAFDTTQYDPNSNRLTYLPTATTWPLPVDNTTQNMSHPSNTNAEQLRRSNSTTATSPEAATTTAPLQTSGLEFHQALDPSATLLTSTAGWQQYSQLNQQHQSSYIQDGTIDTSAFNPAFAGSLQSSPIDFSLHQAAMNTTLSMDAASNFIPVTTGIESMNELAFTYGDLQNQLLNYPVNADATAAATATGDFAAPSVGGSSPGETWLESRSLSSSDNGWTSIEWPPQSRRSIDTYSDHSNVIIFNPTQTLHIRTDSNSSQESGEVPRSAHSFSSYEDGVFPMGSPQSESHLDFTQIHNVDNMGAQYLYHDCSSHASHSSHHSPVQGTVSPVAISEPVPIKPAPSGFPLSSSASPTSSGANSPPLRRKPSPTGKKSTSPITSKLDKVAKTIKKTPSHSTKKDNLVEKKVGRRRGPLRPEQRQQAHEIRKLRACLRCKFLKKTCDKGDPCAGCQPSHARLWQVPCTRIDIKDIGYFMKDWKADYERHVSLGFSVGNIKGFSQIERRVYITHGYGFYLPINAREVYVRDDKCFGVDWVESLHETPKSFECNTAKLSAGMEGVSHQMLSEYLDRHLDGGFERFVDEYFEGTYFLTEILKTAYRFYLREKLPVIRKALKLVLAYNLTLHVTMVEGLDEGEAGIGRVEDKESKFWGKTVAPVMINFQVKCALADMWRELQKDVLEELSGLYSSVYSGDKLKNWPTIFMLAAILLAIWELMQFDCHYRVPDEKAVKKFCDDMESTPVGVIVGLFQAISQKLPSFMEWDTRKHHHLLNSNPAVCDAMTEVRAHVTKYGRFSSSLKWGNHCKVQLLIRACRKLS